MAAESAAERTKARAACAAVYRSIIDKRAKELTVRETLMIDECKRQGWYTAAP